MGVDASPGGHPAILVSDRMGTRPLFNGVTPDGSLVFATQVGAVLSAREIDRERLPEKTVIVLDGARATSFLLVLDAQTFRLLGRSNDLINIAGKDAAGRRRQGGRPCTQLGVNQFP